MNPKQALRETPNSKFMTPQQVAAEYGVSAGRIYQLLAPKGDLPCVRLSLGPGPKYRTRGEIRVKREDWDAWVARHREAPPEIAPSRAAQNLRIRDLPGADRYVS